MFIIVLVGSTGEVCDFGMDEVDVGTSDGGAVGYPGVVQGRLIVLVVEEYSCEKLFEFGPSTRYIRWELGLPIVASFMRVR